MKATHLVLAAVCATTLFAGCTKQVENYCDSGRPCPGDNPVCLMPDHQCGPAIAWGELSGSQELPPNPSDASGSIRIGMNDSRVLVYNLSHNLSGVTGVHLHEGKPGAISPPVLSLRTEQNAIDTLQQLSEDQVTALLAGRYYLDVHTQANAGGEARAQIWPLEPRGLESTILYAVLSGLQESTPTGSTYTGKATVTLDGKTGAISYEINLGGLPVLAVTGLHIHQGGFGADSTHIANLNPAMLSGSLGADAVLDEYKVLYPILLRGGLSYVNVHTADNPGGELRGQLLAGKSAPGPVPFHAILSGQQETPTPLTSNLQGTAHFFLSEDQTVLTYRLKHSASKVTGVAIYRGAVGESGPKVLDLAKDRPQGTIDIGSPGGLGKADLLQGQLYLNILTEQHPQGELRGQIVVPQSK